VSALAGGTDLFSGFGGGAKDEDAVPGTGPMAVVPDLAAEAGVSAAGAGPDEAAEGFDPSLPDDVQAESSAEPKPPLAAGSMALVSATPEGGSVTGLAGLSDGLSVVSLALAVSARVSKALPWAIVSGRPGTDGAAGLAAAGRGAASTMVFLASGFAGSLAGESDGGGSDAATADVLFFPQDGMSEASTTPQVTSTAKAMPKRARDRVPYSAMGHLLESQRVRYRGQPAGMIRNVVKM
jgi:hypothetical protein